VEDDVGSGRSGSSSGRAWSADRLSLPDDTRDALETDGRAELLKVLDQDQPPASYDAALPAARTCRQAKPASGLVEREHGPSHSAWS